MLSANYGEISEASSFGMHCIGALFFAVGLVPRCGLVIAVFRRLWTLGLDCRIPYKPCWKLMQPRILISCALCINVLLGAGGFMAPSAREFASIAQF